MNEWMNKFPAGLFACFVFDWSHSPMTFSELGCVSAALRRHNLNSELSLFERIFIVKHSLKGLQGDPVLQLINMPYMFSG